MKRVAWIVLGCLSLTATTQAASFKCSKAVSKAEKLICGDPELSQLDGELNTAYKMALQSSKQADYIREAQKQWLKARNSCADVDCMELTYKKRLSELSPMPHSSDSNPGGHKPLACPQCGSWNIDSGGVIDETNNLQAVWNDPTGYVLTADDKLISIPACGSFKYKITNSKVWQEESQQYHHLSLVLTKIANLKYPPPCDGDNLQLAVQIEDEHDDNEPGWGGGTFTISNNTEERFRLSGWNPEKRDLSRYGALGEGAAATFELKQVRRDLQDISDKFYKMHGNGKPNPFNVERFDGNVLGYCVETTEGEDGLHTPTRAAFEVGCELQILKAKYKEFQDWHCDTSPSKNLKGVQCKFPDWPVPSLKDT